ncbi:WD40 repeat-like protein [Myriangium duriaei CBS 260.36]|uniref:WD40 repeat-like protein n=1 Tax=Myriangium duriaei CBS 260.36 TaxID=1168546 RepID=A0A9P4IWB6_9PEZI|nr:WD40 repeat-like protein [Myriangium duriaei CBS 260.36]
MYNAHRGIPGANPNSRMQELLEQIRTEFEAQGGRTNDYELQIAAQIQEMDLIRGKIFQIEQSHINMKQKYEEDIARLRRELEARGGPSASSHPNQPPPSIGHGPANLFQGIMAGATAQGGPGLAPPPQDQPQGQGLPAHLQQGPPGLNPAPGPPQHAPFGGYGQPPAPGVNGKSYPPQAPQPTASPGPGKPRPALLGGPNHGGPATPQLGSANPNFNSPAVPHPTPPPNQQQQAVVPYNQQVPDVGNQLCDLPLELLPPQLKREGEDWYAVFNPRVPRTLDVELVHNLPHLSVVCCVRFSRDGRYVATGCNRSAQIFDVESGHQISHLQDNDRSMDGSDLYIRSVCFSPDGHHLATGAEDKIIRIWEISARAVRHKFAGHEQDIYSLDYSSDGRYIASGSGDRTVRLWDIQNNQCMLSLSIEDGVTTVAISPDNRFLAAGSLDKSVRVWDIQTGNLLERLEEAGGNPGHKDSVYSVAFAPQSRELVSGSLDRTIRMWELQPHYSGMRNGADQVPKGGKCIRTFEGHKDFVLSVALTPDGRWVLSGSKDRGVQFWDPASGDAQLMLQGHKNSVISVAPSPARGGLFATGSGDMRARIWRYVEKAGRTDLHSY